MTFLESIFRRVKRAWVERHAEPEIIVGESEFRLITSPTRGETIGFDKITEIVAYKKDLIAMDLICCDIFALSEEGEMVWTIHEEVPGFALLMRAFEQLPGFDKAWWEPVVQPAFERNRTTLYRANDADRV